MAYNIAFFFFPLFYHFFGISLSQTHFFLSGMKCLNCRICFSKEYVWPPTYEYFLLFCHFLTVQTAVQNSSILTTEEKKPKDLNIVLERVQLIIVDNKKEEKLILKSRFHCDASRIAKMTLKFLRPSICRVAKKINFRISNRSLNQLTTFGDLRFLSSNTEKPKLWPRLAQSLEVAGTFIFEGNLLW